MKIRASGTPKIRFSANTFLTKRYFNYPPMKDEILKHQCPSLAKSDIAKVRQNGCFIAK